jgi:hypothetical protein
MKGLEQEAVRADAFGLCALVASKEDDGIECPRCRHAESDISRNMPILTLSVQKLLKFRHSQYHDEECRHGFQTIRYESERRDFLDAAHGGMPLV